MINDARLANGKSTIGFVNPTVSFRGYSHERPLRSETAPMVRFIQQTSRARLTISRMGRILGAVRMGSKRRWGGILSLG
jgi:hypothetical protein